MLCELLVELMFSHNASGVVRKSHYIFKKETGGLTIFLFYTLTLETVKKHQKDTILTVLIDKTVKIV